MTHEKAAKIADFDARHGASFCVVYEDSNEKRERLPHRCDCLFSVVFLASLVRCLAGMFGQGGLCPRGRLTTSWLECAFHSTRRCSVGVFCAPCLASATSATAAAQQSVNASVDASVNASVNARVLLSISLINFSTARAVRVK